MSKFLRALGGLVVAVVVLGACAPAYTGPLTEAGNTPPAHARLGAGARVSLPNASTTAYDIELSEAPDVSGSYEGEAKELTSYTYVGPARLELTRSPDAGYTGRLDYANPFYAWTAFHNTMPNQSEFAGFDVTGSGATVAADGTVSVALMLRSGAEELVWVRKNESYIMFVKLRPMPSGGYFLEAGLPLRFSPEVFAVIDREPGGIPEARLRFDFWPSN